MHIEPADRWDRAAVRPSWERRPDREQETSSATTTTRTATALHDPPTPVRPELAAAWTSFMFVHIYVDYLHLEKPGAVEDTLAGVISEFAISLTFVAVGAADRVNAIASVALFLAGDLSSYMTGTVLEVTGGRLM